METFSHKTKEEILKKFKHTCAFSTLKFVDKCKKNQGLSIHHIIHNTTANRKIYGPFLQSITNAVLLCENCHKPSYLLNHLRDMLLAKIDSGEIDIEINTKIK